MVPTVGKSLSKSRELGKESTGTWVISLVEVQGVKLGMKRGDYGRVKVIKKDQSH